MALSDTQNILTLNFRVYTQAPGSHIVVCQNCPLIMFSCASVADCIDKAREKVEFYLEKGKNLFEHTERREQTSKTDVWHFDLVYDMRCKSYLKLEMNETSR